MIVLAAAAWVMWMAPATMDPDVPLALVQNQYYPRHMSAVSAYETKQACEDAVSKNELGEWQGGLNRNAKKKPHERWDTFVWTCLPEHVDPRPR